MLAGHGIRLDIAPSLSLILLFALCLFALFCSHPHAIAWSPDGSLIAVGQTLFNKGNRLQVSFFESNGLRHGEALLFHPAAAKPSSEALQICGLGWSGDGEVLAVQLQSPATFLLQLLHRDNYRWGVKWWEAREVQRRGEQGGSAEASPSYFSFCWASALSPLVGENQLGATLRLTTFDAFSCELRGRRRSFLLGYSSACEAFGSEGSIDTGAVGCIDGSCVRFTAAALSPVPPPMAYSTLSFVCRPPESPAASPLNLREISLTRPDRVGGGSVPSVRFAALAYLPQSGYDPLLLLSSLSFLGSGAQFSSLLSSLVVDAPASPSIPVAVSARVGAEGDVGRCSLGPWSSGLPNLAVVPLPLCASVNDTGSVSPYSLRLLTHLCDEYNSGVQRSYFAVVKSIADGSSTSKDTLLLFSLSSKEGPTSHLVDDSFELASAADNDAVRLSSSIVLHIAPIPGGRSFLVHTDDGLITRFVLPASGKPLSDLRSQVACRLPELASTVIPLHSSNVSAKNDGFMGVASLALSSSRLYINEVVLSPSCGSAVFVPFHQLLLFTALGPLPTLVASHASALHDLIKGSSSATTAADTEGDLKSGAAPLSIDAGVAPRVIERGARIVTSCSASLRKETAGSVSAAGSIGSFVHDGDAIVLQMPRGNIEIIRPRALVLSTIRQCLDGFPALQPHAASDGELLLPTRVPDIAAALEICRRHRIDNNLVVDHNPWLLASPEVMEIAVKTLIPFYASKATIGSDNLVRKGASLCGSDRVDLLLSSLDPVDVTGVVLSAADTFAGAKHPPPPFYKRTDLPQVWSALPRDGVGSGFVDGCGDLHARLLPLLPSSALPCCITSFEPGIAALLCLSASFDPKQAPAGAAKVNAACARIRLALLTAMLDVSEEVEPCINWTHPLACSVITSYARQIPADLESALRVTQAVARYEQHEASLGRSRGTGPRVSAEQAQNHAILVADSDVELLYTTALGMYDLRLAYSLAARSSSLDPREYLPFLAKLGKMGQTAADPTSSDPSNAFKAALFQRFAIDIHLGRGGRAMFWLSSLAAFACIRPKQSTSSEADHKANAKAKALALLAARGLAASASSGGSAAGNQTGPSDFDCSRWSEADITAACRYGTLSMAARINAIFSTWQASQQQAPVDTASSVKPTESLLLAAERCPILLALSMAGEKGLQLIDPSGTSRFPSLGPSKSSHASTCLRLLADAFADPVGFVKLIASDLHHEGLVRAAAEHQARYETNMLCTALCAEEVWHYLSAAASEVSRPPRQGELQADAAAAAKTLSQHLSAAISDRTAGLGTPLRLLPESPACVPELELVSEASSSNPSAASFFAEDEEDAMFPLGGQSKPNEHRADKAVSTLFTTLCPHGKLDLEGLETLASSATGLSSGLAFVSSTLGGWELGTALPLSGAHVAIAAASLFIWRLRRLEEGCALLWSIACVPELQAGGRVASLVSDLLAGCPAASWLAAASSMGTPLDQAVLLSSLPSSAIRTQLGIPAHARSHSSLLHPITAEQLDSSSSAVRWPTVPSLLCDTARRLREASIARLARASQLPASMLHPLASTTSSSGSLSPSVRPAASFLSAEAGKQGIITYARLVTSPSALAPDVEGAVEALLAFPGTWSEASRLAATLGRADLFDTVIQPSFRQAVSRACEDLSRRKELLGKAYELLRQCRQLRASMGLEKLLGAAEAARFETALQSAKAGGLGDLFVSQTDALDAAALVSASIDDVAMKAASAGIAAGAAALLRSGGAFSSSDDSKQSADDSSVITGDGWSEASSVVSRADDMRENRGSDLKSLSSFGSSASASNSVYSKSQGRFSHLPQSSIPVTFINTSSSLVLEADGVTRAQAAAQDAAAALRAAHKHEAKRGGNGGDNGSVLSVGSARSDRSSSTRGGGVKALNEMLSSPLALAPDVSHTNEGELSAKHAERAERDARRQQRKVLKGQAKSAGLPGSDSEQANLEAELMSVLAVTAAGDGSLQLERWFSETEELHQQALLLFQLKEARSIEAAWLSYAEAVRAAAVGFDGSRTVASLPLMPPRRFPKAEATRAVGEAALAQAKEEEMLNDIELARYTADLKVACEPPADEVFECLSASVRLKL